MIFETQVWAIRSIIARFLIKFDRTLGCLWVAYSVYWLPLLSLKVQFGYQIKFGRNLFWTWLFLFLRRQSSMRWGSVWLWAREWRGTGLQGGWHHQPDLTDRWELVRGLHPRPERLLPRQLCQGHRALAVSMTLWWSNHEGYQNLDAIVVKLLDDYNTIKKKVLLLLCVRSSRNFLLALCFKT